MFSTKKTPEQLSAAKAYSLRPAAEAAEAAQYEAAEAAQAAEAA
jgi:hypothetical protein